MSKEARNEAVRNRRRDRRIEAVKQLGGSCARCGADESLEFDHIDPSSKHPALKTTGAMWGWKPERIREELSKCQLLCKPCHIKKSSEAYPDRVHGTMTMYQKGHCRCILCKAWSKEFSASQRENNRVRSPH